VVSITWLALIMMSPIGILTLTEEPWAKTAPRATKAPETQFMLTLLNLPPLNPLKSMGWAADAELSESDGSEIPGESIA